MGSARVPRDTGVPVGSPGLRSAFWFNPELSSRFFLVPGCIAIVMALVGTLLTSLVVAREWERGTMEAMMATPVTAVELLLGKVIPYFILGLASMSLCALVAVFVFGVPFRGSVVALYAISAAFLLPALGQGLLISAATKNQFLASQLALLSAFLPTFLLSGFLFEIASMPKVDPVAHQHRARAVADPQPADGVSRGGRLAAVRPRHRRVEPVRGGVPRARHAHDEEAGRVMWTRLCALIVKELLVVLRDPRAASS